MDLASYFDNFVFLYNENMYDIYVKETKTPMEGKCQPTMYFVIEIF